MSIDGEQTEEVMLAGRNIGTLVGIFTMTATWVSGAYINGTAEALYNGGLLGCQAPFGYALSLVIGGILFAKKMRDEGYITMLDPFQVKYGQRVGGLLFIPALLGEVFLDGSDSISPCTLHYSILGATLSVILEIDMTLSVIISAIIAVFYTFTGGLYAVAYTDVVQLFCIFVGLWVCVPASLLQDKTKDISRNAADWIGTIGGFKETTLWIDCMLLLILVVYFQRVLSSKSSSGAQNLSFVAGIGCILMAIPPALIGAIARNTEQTNMVVPLVFQYLTPKWVAFIGLGAVSAAVMSSADSSVLSAASMFAHNIWKLAIRPNAHEEEVICVMRIAIVAVGFSATLMALTINSIYGLWYLCADLVYVILFPQLVCVVYFKHSNTYGSVIGYVGGKTVRHSELSFSHFEQWLCSARSSLALALLIYPNICLQMVRFTLGKVLKFNFDQYDRGILPIGMDFLKCVVNIPPERIALHSDVSFNVSNETLNAQKPKDSGENYRRNFLKPSDAPMVTELSTLQPSNNKDYLTLSKDI
ncbi:High-affinity choline transporter 1 [Dirofilaria immitis]|nr:High-affinity choline transporter 1 [Dirofilaria immitis]